MSSTLNVEDRACLEAIGQRIRDARTKKGLSQEKFAQVCMLDRTYISDVERGTRNISILNLRKFAVGLDVSMAKLIGKM